jgi:hypothetical protein
MKRLLYAAGGVHPLPTTVAVALLAGPVPPEPDDELEAPLDDELVAPPDDELVAPPDDELVAPPDDELELGPDVLVAPEVVPDVPFEEVAPDASPPAPECSPPPHAESNASTEPPARSEHLRIVTFLLCVRPVDVTALPG